MIPADIDPASLLYGFANNARVFPWSASREHIRRAFETYVDLMFPDLSSLERFDRLNKRWSVVFTHIERTAR